MPAPPVAATSTHLIIAFAAPGTAFAADRTCPSRVLSEAWPQLKPVARDEGDAYSLTPPHERVLARALGLPVHDGAIPWAAHATGVRATPCAWITPCHWHLGTDHVTLGDPLQLQWAPATAGALFELLAPWFAEDGIQLEFTQPGQWLARGEVFRDLRCASLDRAINRHVDRWTQPLDAAPQLRRLQTEVQMLLYDHAFNHARTEQGLLPVNAFWVSGAGVCDAGDGQDAVGSPPILVNLLRDGALAGDAQAWREAWARVDHDHIAPALQGGQGLRLTLCGEQHAVSLETATPGLLQRLLLPFQRKNGSERAWDLLCSL